MVKMGVPLIGPCVVALEPVIMMQSSALLRLRTRLIMIVVS